MTPLVRWTLGAILGVVVLWGAATIVYVQDTTEYVVVTRLGEPVRTELEPGLRGRLPWGLERLERLSARQHLLLPPDSEYLTRDKRNLLVSSYLLWRVSDPLKFVQSVKDRDGAEARLAFVLSSEIGTVLGTVTLEELVNDGVDPDGLERMSTSLAERCSAVAGEEYGIEVVDVRVRRLGFPDRNRISVYERMRAERNRIAVKYRSEGEEEATKIRSGADVERAVILAAAEREAAEIRGEGEAEAARIYAEAYQADPSLYEFLRKLEAYETIIDPDTTLVLPADADVLELLLEGPEGAR
jgi:modulator of FtsH protease HflC